MMCDAIEAENSAIATLANVGRQTKKQTAENSAARLPNRRYQTLLSKLNPRSSPVNKIQISSSVNTKEGKHHCNETNRNYPLFSWSREPVSLHAGHFTPNRLISPAGYSELVV
jgi:hypothetical protein